MQYTYCQKIILGAMARPHCNIVRRIIMRSNCTFKFQLADECAEAQEDEITNYETDRDSISNYAVIDTNQNCDTTNIEYCEKTDSVTRRHNKTVQNGVKSKSKQVGVQGKSSEENKSKTTEPVKVSLRSHTSG